MRLRGNDAAYYLANRDHMDSSVIALHYIFDSVSTETAKKHLAKGKRQIKMWELRKKIGKNRPNLFPMTLGEMCA